MKSVSLLALALVAPALLVASPAEAARKEGGYVDILSAQASGEFASQRYDVYQKRGDDERFIGNVDARRGTFLGGGFGMRLVYGAKNGLRISGESSYQAGRIIGGELPFGAISVAQRAEMLGSVGYNLITGRFVWHVAGVLGCDFTSFKVAQPAFGPEQSLTSGSSALATTSTGPNSPLADEIFLKRWGLRAGAQVGVHLQLAEMMALYSDATFDYDGQWRARFGFAIGNIGKAHR